MLGSTLREDVVAETLGGCLVKDAILLEYAEGIGIEHLCPFVAVVASCISSCHDVGELYGHTGILSLWQNHRLLPCLLLEWDDVGGEFIFLGVVCHVEQTETYLAQAGIGCHEVAALYDALNELVGQWLAGLVMEGKGAEKVFLYRIVLHKLRWQLYEIPPYVGA